MVAERIVVFLLMLSVLVVLHEYGHFIVARLTKVRVTDFALGFGPTLLKWTSPRSGTVYRWNALPLGGYCQMKGEDGQSNEAEQQREFREARVYDADNFQSKTPLQRLAIVAAGPTANFIIALVLLFGVAFASGVPSAHPSLVIGQLVKDNPADRAGLHSGDRIVSINGRTMRDGEEAVALIHASAGKQLRVGYQRDGVLRTVDVVPILSAGPDGKREGHLGFSPVFPVTDRWNAVAASRAAWQQFTGMIGSTLGAFGGLFVHPSEVAGQFQGPIGIGRAAIAVQQLGVGPFVAFAALLSIALGIFNFLPIPALDGGRAAFIIVEMLRGRPVDPEKEALVHIGGFAVLIVLMLAVSWHDVARIAAGQGVF